MFVDLPPELPPSAEYVMLFDASKPSSSKRLTLVKMGKKGVPEILIESTVAHGTGSDPDRDGKADGFSNEPESNATSLGLYKVSEGYIGKYGLSYRLIGLSATNSNALKRAVVLHPAPYVSDTGAGRSFGCPALSFSVFDTMEHLGVFRAKTYIYIYDSVLGLKRANTIKRLVKPYKRLPMPKCSKASIPEHWAANKAFDTPMSTPCDRKVAYERN